MPPRLAAFCCCCLAYALPALAGGGALLRGLDRHIQEQTNIVTRIAEDPLKCVALGTGKALDEIEVFKKALITD